MASAGAELPGLSGAPFLGCRGSANHSSGGGGRCRRTAHLAARRPWGPDELLLLARGPGAPATPGPVRRADAGCPRAGPACGAAVSAGELAASRGAEKVGGARGAWGRLTGGGPPPLRPFPRSDPRIPPGRRRGALPRWPPPSFPFRSGAEESVFCTYS